MPAADALFLPQLADQLEAQHPTKSGQFGRYGGPDTTLIAIIPLQWTDVVGSVVERPISTLEDLNALARICRSAGSENSNATTRQRDALAEKLHTAVIGFSGCVNDIDSELLALHDQFIDLERQGRTSFQTFSDDDAGDAARELLIRKQKGIVCQSRAFNAITPAGHQALARMLLAWSRHIKPRDHDSDSGEDQLLWLLLRNLLGIDHATALASDDSNVVLQALTTGYR